MAKKKPERGKLNRVRRALSLVYTPKHKVYQLRLFDLRLYVYDGDLMADDKRRSYGHQIVHMRKAFQLAAMTRSPVLVLRSAHEVNRWIYSFRDERLPVGILPPRLGRLVGRLLKGLIRWKWLEERQSLDELKQIVRRVEDAFYETGWVKPQLTSQLMARGWEYLRAAGIGASQPIVCIHCRYRGYKEEIGLFEARHDLYRNSDIEHYRLAVDYLVERGYTVFRLGDPTMPPFAPEGCVDLAHADRQERQWLEVFLVSQCAFYIASDSGPSELAKFLQKPTLYVNIFNPKGNFPLLKTDRMLPKRIHLLREDRTPGLRELWSGHCIEAMRGEDGWWDFDAFEMHQNSPEDILEGVKEFLESDLTQHSPEQQHFNELVFEYYCKVKERAYTQGFGEGVISQGFLEKYG